MLLTILGEFVLPHASAVWTSTIVEALGLLGIGERNARQAIARLRDDGLVVGKRHGRTTRWRLTDGGERLLTVGAERIYRFGSQAVEWDGHWLVVLASVPEEQRAKRHQLRSQLGFIGFGFLAPGIAVSPHVERQPEANSILSGIELGEAPLVLVATLGSLAPDAEIIRRAWDLDSLGRRYDDFVRDFDHRQPHSPSASLIALAELVHRWRRFPVDDPEIPDRLLPARWPGWQAKQLFDARRGLWSPGAKAWFAEVEAAGG